MGKTTTPNAWGRAGARNQQTKPKIAPAAAARQSSDLAPVLSRLHDLLDRAAYLDTTPDLVRLRWQLDDAVRAARTQSDCEAALRIAARFGREAAGVRA